MKKLLKGTSSFVLLMAVLLPVLLQAKPSALVSSVEGNAFVVYNGSTKPIKSGEYLEDMSIIMTEEGGQVAISDFHDHKFFLAGSGMATILNRMVELKRGYLWVQSLATEKAKLQTANAVVNYTNGDAVFSFDSMSGKTQLMVVRGSFELQNVLRDDVSVTVDQGNFSFIDDEYEQGIPRTPTPVGFQSFQKVISLFRGVDAKYVESDDAIMKKNAPVKRVGKVVSKGKNRAVASIESKATGGKITYRLAPKRKTFDIDAYNERKIASIEDDKRRAKFVPDYSARSGVAVRVYGVKKSERAIASVETTPTTAKPEVIAVKPEAPKSTAKRAPASISELNPQVSIKPANEFEGALLEAYKKQKRHSEEVNGLIDELKSYSQDYKKGY